MAGSPTLLAVRVELLGPVRAEVEGQDRTPAGKRDRALIALLALAAGEAVAVDQVTAGLWGSLVPPAGTLDSLVERVRSECAGPALTSGPDGLALAVETGDVDALEVDAWVAETAQQEPAVALGAVERALARWRGPVLGGVEDVPFARPHVERLTELRTLLVEERFDLMMQL